MCSIVALRVSRLSPSGLVSLGEKIVEGLRKHPDIYVSPVPSLQSVSDNLLALKNANTKCGVKGNRGSRRDFIQREVFKKRVCDDLTRFANYAESIVGKD